MPRTKSLVASALFLLAGSLVVSACIVHTRPQQQPAAPEPPPAPTAAPTAEADAAPAPTTSPEPAKPYYACAGKRCGDACTVCDPADKNCVETAVVKQCTANDRCEPAPAQCGTAAATPQQPAYNPCEGKKCGDRCRQCKVGDPKCVESPLVKLCHPDGQCKEATTVDCSKK
jgi:hypothetical protein